MKIRDRINADLIAAMKSREADRLSVLRMMKAAIKNKEVDLCAELDDTQAIQVLSSMVKQHRDSVEQFGRGGRNDLAEKEAAEILVIEEYLPAAVSNDEIAAVIDEVVRETGASDVRDIGAVMKQCMARFAGKLVDGKKVNALVRARLERT